MNSDALTIYSAMDIARLLVRNPDEAAKFVPYSHTCQKFCKNRPIEKLSKKEKSHIFSKEMAVSDLEYLGFSDEQIDVFVSTYNAAYKKLDIANIEADIPALYSPVHLSYNAYAIVCMPYGPPFVLTYDYNALARDDLSLTKTRSVLNKLTTTIADRLTEIRFEENPHLLSTYTPIPSLENNPSP